MYTWGYKMWDSGSGPCGPGLNPAIHIAFAFRYAKKCTNTR